MTVTGFDSYSSNLRQAAAAALADVDALGVAGEDRAIILRSFLRARLDGLSPVVPSPADAEGTAARSPEVGGAPDVLNVSDVLGRIGTVLKVDRDTLELIYDVRDGEPHVVVSPKKLPENKALATRQLGQLVAAARQAAGLEEWTSATTIRVVVQDYGRLDRGNFAVTLQQLDNACLIRGKGKQREVKVTRPGLENTAELLRTMAGTAS